MYKPQSKDELNSLINNLEISLKDIDVSEITDMSGLFFGTKRTDFDGINEWNTSNVKDMSFMFDNCKSFNHPLNFDTSNVTDMSGMFFNCENFNQSLNFNTINVTDMSYMFSGCKKFNQQLNFNTSKVQDISYMFFECYKFNQQLNFDTSNLINCKFFIQKSKNIETDFALRLLDILLVKDCDD